MTAMCLNPPPFNVRALFSHDMLGNEGQAIRFLAHTLQRLHLTSCLQGASPVSGPAPEHEMTGSKPSVLWGEPQGLRVSERLLGVGTM